MQKETGENQRVNPGIFSLSDQTGGQKRFVTISLVDQISQALRESILTGRIKGGDQLLEDKLKDEFGVSRTPLREAFRILEKEGLIEIMPRKGSFVRGITRQDIEENFPVRAILEGLAARLAYPDFTPRDIEEMEEIFEYMKKAAKDEDFGDYSMYHFDFHEIFINASKNETLITLLRNLRMHTLWHRYTYQYYKEDFRNSLMIHRKILDMFEEKKASSEEIEKTVRRHIEVALDPFLEAMKELEEGVAK